MSSKRILLLTHQYERTPGLQSVPIGGSGKPPDKGVMVD